MDKHYRNMVVWGSVLASFTGALAERWFEVVPLIEAVIALSVASFALSVAALIALMIAPVKRVLFDRRDSYFVTRLHRFCNALQFSAVYGFTVAALLAVTPPCIVSPFCWSALWGVAYNTKKQIEAFAACVTYPTNPY
jgi:hypothetical protein